MKKYFSLCLLLIVVSSATAQTLKTTNLNLNAGGVIHDVAFDDYYNAYVVVGNFTSINGQLRNNLAFIDANTLMVLDQTPISSIDGAIRSVEVYNYTYIHPILGFSERSYMYLGGNFTDIGGQTRVYLARFSATHVYSQPPLTPSGLADFILNPWNANLLNELWNESGVQDLLLSGDTLTSVGRFQTTASATYTAGVQYNNIVAFNAEVTNPTLKPVFTNFSQTNSLYSIQGVRKLGNRFYTFGKETATNNEFIYEHNQSGAIVQQIESCGTEQAVWDFEPHPTTADTLLFSYEDYAASYGITSYRLNGTLWHCQAGGGAGNSMLNLTTVGAGGFFEVYKNFIFNTNATGIYTSKRNGTSTVPVLTNIPLNANWAAVPNLVANASVKKVRNLLFLSGSNLTSVNSTPRTGLALFCLEPTAAQPFTQSDPIACEGDSSTYTIPQAQCADGYRWTYTGTGVFYRVSGSANPWAALSSINVVGLNANSIEILYPLGATSGTLSVEPYTQFSAADKHYSQGQSISITITPLPNVTLAPNFTLNCYSDTVHMVAQSTTPNVLYSWVFNNGGSTSNNDTILITASNGNGSDIYPYNLIVTNPVTGCINSASTNFTFDLIAPPIDPYAVTTIPPVFDCNTTSMFIHSNVVGATVTWTSPSEIGIFNDPYVITSVPSGNLTVYATYLSNGCEAQADYGGIIVDQTPADGELLGYTLGLLITDSLNCTVPTLSLTCDVTTPFSGFSNAQWLDNGVPTGSNILNISAADSVGMNALLVKVFVFRTYNTNNSCTNDYNVRIKFDFEQPTVPSLADASLNCSQSTVQLTHPINGNSWVNEGWLDQSGAQTGSDVIVATTIGDYFYQVEDTINGCTNADTVAVTQTNELTLEMIADTLVCVDQVVLISPSIIGNTEVPTYLWSDGSTAQTASAIGGIDPSLSVIVTTPNGCVGYDTTTISITAPVLATIVPIGGCELGNLQITNVTGGQGNYLYSLDGAPFQSQTAFTNLVFGTYTISIQDDLGCVYDFTQILNGQTLQAIEMQFAVATYNQQGDTLVLVNITEFTGLDSVAWEVPLLSDVVFDSDSVLVLSIANQGWYDVTLRGYSGICEYSLTKAVYFGDQVPVFDTTFASNGIDSLTVSPNPSLDGNFSVYVLFGTAQNYTILVTNNLGQPIPSMSITTQGINGSHPFSFPFGTPNGIYRVHVIADYDARQKSILLDQ